MPVTLPALVLVLLSANTVLAKIRQVPLLAENAPWFSSRMPSTALVPVPVMLRTTELLMSTFVWFSARIPKVWEVPLVVCVGMMLVFVLLFQPPKVSRGPESTSKEPEA